MYIRPHASPPNPPRQPKIRSSCDGCGVVKGKCDRQLPECGRCLARGISCTYSISRKIGKPRKDRTLNGNNAAPSTPSRLGLGHSGGSTSNHPAGSSAGSSNINGSIKSSSKVNSNSDVHVNRNTHTDASDDFNSSIDCNDDKGHDHEIFNLDFDYAGDMLSTCLDPNLLPSLSFGELMFPDTFDSLATRLSHFETYANVDMLGYDMNDQQLSDNGGSLSSCAKIHDCHREAQELMRTSLFSNHSSKPDHKPQRTGKVDLSPSRHLEGSSTSVLETPYSDTRDGSGHEVSLDQVLLLNRKVNERLDPLLDCPCAASPYLMMLYSSLISSILMRCQHAVGSSSSKNRIISQGDLGEMARVSIGTFRVDDPRVKSAINLQLLAGELRAVTSLIDKIALYDCHNEAVAEQSGSNNLGKLYQNLALWLRDEHSRVTDIIRKRLWELSA